MQYLTNNRLFSVTISQDDIAKIIQKLDSGNAHGHDNFSIRMLKICGSAIYKPLGIIFKQFVNTGVFPSEWKKGNIVFICKKDEKLKNWKQTLKNYLPVSLLPICGKILERLMFNVMFKFFIQNELISSNQPGFTLGDSCVNHLVSITHETNLLTRSWGYGHLQSIWQSLARWYNFQINSKRNVRECTKALAWLFKWEKQRVVLNGQASTWTNLTAGVPQGSIQASIYCF